MIQTKRRGLMWCRHDLRTEDNAALHYLASEVDELLCVFVVDPRWFKSSHYQSRHMGDYRWQFLKESLLDLQTQLVTKGQRLTVLTGTSVSTLADLIARHHITHVAANFHPATYERQQWKRIQSQCPHTQFQQFEGVCLFDQTQLPFELDDLPNHFTPFRKKVESLVVPDVLPSPTRLPKPWSHKEQQLTIITEESVNDFIGGSQAALAQIKYFMSDSQNISHYKQTRNGLDGWDYSSKLSPWLANGSLSVRQAYAALKRYENDIESNESTYWLFFELLWRDFFQWSLLKHGSKLFKFDGIQGKKPLTTFHARRFSAWKNGETPYPIVNACMHQLNATGFMSNRGRQLVASCFVHELGLDWRFGAAYFEQQLIDFDPASNWGNWQYLAGVGADPRGHRQFDLSKQTATYDPQGHFIRRWRGEAVAMIETEDAADWPVFTPTRH